jgi:ABC-2 type transport system ATP-binding protein
VGLDAISKQQVFSELLAAVSEEGRTVFISSHSLTDLERFADYVGMIKSGKMMFEGQMSGVIERYRMVDFIAKGSADFSNQPGLVVQSRQDNRWRVLVDVVRTPMEWIQSRGATPISDSPVTLEELFIALGKD